MMLFTIEPNVHAKIMHWVRKADKNEVSGFGKIISYNGNPHIIEASLLDQVNSPGHTSIDAGALARLMYELRETEGDLNYWWHSHGRGAAFFSQTDYDTIEELGGEVVAAPPRQITAHKDSQSNVRVLAGGGERAEEAEVIAPAKKWIAATCFNIAGDTHSAFLSTSPIRIFSGEIDLQVASRYIPVGAIDEWDREYAAKVRIERPRRRQRRNWRGHGHDDWWN